MASKLQAEIAGLEALMHGVFAIAITLLVLDIRVPPLDSTASGSELVRSLIDGWPRYLAYTLGFMFIGTYWLNVNRVLRLLRRVDHWFAVLGLILLMLIAALPFVTALLAEYIQQGNGRDQVAAVVFNGWMLILAIWASGSIYYARRRGLLRPRLEEAALRSWMRLASLAPAVWLVAIAVAAFAGGTVALILDCVILALFLQEVPIPDEEAAPGA